MNMARVVGFEEEKDMRAHASICDGMRWDGTGWASAKAQTEARGAYRAPLVLK